MRVKQSGKSRPARTLPWERRQRKTLRTIYLVVALTILVMGFPKLYFHWQMARENRLIRAMGLPATLDEMNQDGPDTPSATHAEAYAKAFDILLAKDAVPFDSHIARRIEESPLDQPLDSKILQDIRKNMARCAPALDLLETAAQSPIRRFPAEIRGRYESRHSLRIGADRAADQLAFAALLAAEDHDPDEACRWLLTLMTVIDSMRLEYADGAYYFRIASLKLARDALEHALALVEFSDDQLAALVEAWIDADDPKAVLRMLAAERQEQLVIYRYPQLVISRYSSRWSSLDRLGPNTTRRTLVTTDILGWNAGDKVRYLREMRGLISALSEPWHMFLPRFEHLEEKYIRQPDYPLVYYPRLSQRIMGEALHHATYFLQSTAELRLTAAALALERYRLRYGQYPDALDELAPDFVPAVPVDPANGGPLRYCFTDTGVAVYSISMNLKDDGGISTAPYRHWRWDGDIVFELRPAMRRADFSMRPEAAEDKL
jgi:hypothetical protein